MSSAARPSSAPTSASGSGPAPCYARPAARSAASPATLIHPLRLTTELAENASHLGAFKKAMRAIEKDGLPTGPALKEAIQTAASVSRNTAVDAARIGAKMHAVNMIDAFANITIQDTDRIMRAFKDDWKGTSLKIAAGITLPSVLLWFANHDDPRYAEIPQWERLN